MSFKNLHKKPWYPYAAAGCIVVVLYVVLVHIAPVLKGIRTFLGYFYPVFIGLTMAYMMNQLSVFYQAKIFFKIKSDTKRNIAGVVLSAVTVVACIVSALIMLVPQLVTSVTMFANNLKSYEGAVKEFILNWHFLSDKVTAKILDFLDSSGGILEYISNYVVDHLNNVIPAVANTGKNIILWIIAFILALYFLSAKQMLKTGLKRFLHALCTEKRYEWLTVFLHRCNQIIATFLVYNIVDAVIIGLANAAFMVIANMSYVGLISFIVGLMNLIPTFGPIIGALVGALLLFLVNPWHALAFLIFTAALQACDGYIIKPKLFGNILGVPGLWVLVSVVVFGRALGVIGILLAIPAIAILDYIYKDHFLPWLEKRHVKKEAAAAWEEKSPSPNNVIIGSNPDSDEAPAESQQPPKGN